MFYSRGVPGEQQFCCCADGLGMIPCSSGTDSIIGSVFVFFETQMARASIISGASDDAQAYEGAYSVVSLFPLELCSRGAEGALALK